MQQYAPGLIISEDPGAVFPVAYQRMTIGRTTGRYVCNYTYFLSLLHQQQLAAGLPMQRHALFVHVPVFEVVDKAQQCAVLRKLLLELCKELVGNYHPPAQ